MQAATPSQAGMLPLAAPQKQDHKQRYRSQCGENIKQRPLRRNSLEDAVEDSRVDHQWNRVGDDVKNIEPADAKVQGRERARETGRNLSGLEVWAAADSQG